MAFFKTIITATRLELQMLTIIKYGDLISSRNTLKLTLLSRVTMKLLIITHHVNISLDVLIKMQIQQNLLSNVVPMERYYTTTFLVEHALVVCTIHI